MVYMDKRELVRLPWSRLPGYKFLYRSFTKELAEFPGMKPQRHRWEFFLPFGLRWKQYHNYTVYISPGNAKSGKRDAEWNVLILTLTNFALLGGCW